MALDAPTAMPGRERLVLRGVLLVVLSSVVVVWWKPDPGGFRSMSLVVQAGVVALTAAFAVYCVAKEVQLSRLRRMPSTSGCAPWPRPAACVSSRCCSRRARR
ncbi:MAG: hypothetical protein M3Q48_11230 [Actinomycetota bacterium]|nr:hypothetical protein [Actinomycetota bacterium]